MSIEFYREHQPGEPSHGDYLAIDNATQDYYRDQGKDEVEGRAAAIAGCPSSVCTTAIGLEFLAEKCRRVPLADVPLEWRKYINLDHDGDRFEDGGTELASRLDDAEAAFAAAGGRGVELADAIDSLRVALAVREAVATAAKPCRRYRATFDPQAWINDYAVSVDPEGETAWDCTAFVTSPPDRLDGFGEAAVLAAIEADGYFLDRDDVLKDDPAAPEWVREWAGPFTITVEVEEAG